MASKSSLITRYSGLPASLPSQFPFPSYMYDLHRRIQWEAEINIRLESCALFDDSCFSFPVETGEARSFNPLSVPAIVCCVCAVCLPMSPRWLD